MHSSTENSKKNEREDNPQGDNAPPNGTIHVILGEPIDGDSDQAR